MINKPPGMVVHPGAGNIKKTLVNALMHHYKNSLSNLSGEDRPGIVHRIDKDTSGLVVVAKNNFIHSELSKQFSNHSITRKYLALIWGSLRPLSGKIETVISRDIRNRQLMSVSESKGKRAITNFKTLKVYQKNKIRPNNNYKISTSISKKLAKISIFEPLWPPKTIPKSRKIDGKSILKTKPKI